MTRDLLHGRRLAANVVWNLLGQGLPMLVALACIPPLVARLGNERFGILSVAWMLVGYFSLFDFGLGWALTRVVAGKLGAGEAAGIPAVVWPALSIMALLSVVGGLILGAIAPWFVTGVFTITPALQDEAIAALVVMALSVPAVVLSASLRGVLEAHQRFVGINVLRTVQGSVNFIAPLAVTAWSVHLGWVVAVLAVSRWLVCGVLAVMCLRAIPGLGAAATWRLTGVAPLVRMGGWMTASNVLAPLMMNCDRIFAAILLPVVLLVFYTVPNDLISRLLIAPAAICGVLFPALSTAMSGDAARIGPILRQGMTTVLLLVGAACMALGLFAPEFLHWWLGEAFARESAGILRILAIGIVLNAAATVPFSALMAAGKAPIIAKAMLLELLVYAPVLWLFIGWWGLPGIALAWTLRAGLDAVVMGGMLCRTIPDTREALVSAVLLCAILILPVVLALWATSVESRVALGCLGVMVAAWVGWKSRRFG